MTAAELMFFFGAPLAHVVQYEEQLKELRRDQAARRMTRVRRPFGAVATPIAPRELCDAEAGR